MLIAQYRGSLFLILLVERAKLLAHDWSSGCLATAYAIELCFSVTKRSRLEIVAEECIEELKDKSETENTNNSKEWRNNVFKKWANERNLLGKEYESDVLDQTLTTFGRRFQYLLNKLRKPVTQRQGIHLDQRCIQRLNQTEIVLFE